MSIVTTTQRGNARRERGAALIEMALVAPLLVLLLFGIWSVARAYNVKNTMDHAVREGARFGATVDPWDANSPNAVLAVIQSELAASAIPPAWITVGCLELVEEGNNGCTIDGADQVVGAPANQVVVNILFDDYPLNFVFFNLEVDFQSQAMARHES
jgi:Flp pilus assembly protein TadG